MTITMIDGLYKEFKDVIKVLDEKKDISLMITTQEIF